MTRERLASLALVAAFAVVVGLAAADAVRKRDAAPAADTVAELPGGSGWRSGGDTSPW